MVAMNSNPEHPDKLTDPKVEPRIKTQTKAILNLVTTYYRVELETPSQGIWQLDFSEYARKASPRVLILYPHELWPCSDGAEDPAIGR